MRMPDQNGPWRHEPDEPDEPDRAPPRSRLLIWLALMVGVGVLVALLAKAFPGQPDEDTPWIARSMLALALVSTALFARGRIDWGEKARHAAIWLAVGVLLVTLASYRDELGGVANRVRGAFSGGYPVATGPREFAISQSSDGGFYVMGKVNGQPVRFLVDTGASQTVLSPADARRLGVDLDTLSFDQLSETANGVGRSAPYVLDSLEIGPARLEHTPVLVNQTPMSASLLGMSFLRRLESFQIKGHTLYLTVRG